MENWGIATVGSNINEALDSVLHGKNTPEEREEALVDFIKKYEESANKCIEDWKIRALAKNVTIATVVVVGILSALAAAGITALFFIS